MILLTSGFPRSYHLAISQSATNLEVAMTRHAIALSACLLLGSAMLAAQTGGAMLYANGTVNVNGQLAGNSSSVFAGDRIDVTASSAGSINRTGSSVVISPNSSIEYEPSSIDVIDGTARISTNKGMTASAGTVSVSPKDATAKFDVVRTNDKVVVVSREGALTVTDGTRTMLVQPGSSTELAVGDQELAQDASKANTANFLPPDRLTEHPFYGALNGVSAKPDTLPICDNILTCIRPSVSKIHPCCCPPVVLCN